MFYREEFQTLKARLEEPRRLIQVVLGPRGVGKTTVVKEALAGLDVPWKFFSAERNPDSARPGWFGRR